MIAENERISPSLKNPRSAAISISTSIHDTHTSTRKNDYPVSSLMSTPTITDNSNISLPAVENLQLEEGAAPRRSNRVAADLTPSDGDVWQERLAVCEGVTPDGEPRLLIRSFYRNARTQERVWDEPPTGAATVRHATSEMRKTAELEREELRLTLDMIPPEDEQTATTKIGNSSSLKEKKGFLSRFRKKKEQKQVETAKDLNLQRAIALSMADQARIPHVDFDGVMDTGGRKPSENADDEDIALAKALSMSEALANSYVDQSPSLNEEEMFQRALEQSQKCSNSNNDAMGVASMPKQFEESFSSIVDNPLPSVNEFDPNESDRKLPAILRR